MPSCAAPEVDHALPFRDHVLEDVELGAQEGLDREWLRRRIERAIQHPAAYTSSFDMFKADREVALTRLP
jgi:hypothetical protein